MKFWGYHDARVTPSGSDGGVDVRAANALAQVKREAKPVGRPTVQRLVGARGRDVSLQLLFFSQSGYSQGALEYASQVGMALFRYDAAGSMTGSNITARRIIDRAGEPVPIIDLSGKRTKVEPLWDPSYAQIYYFRASERDVEAALQQMHRMGSEGDMRRPARSGRKTTIAPTWLKEYAGLVSITADLKTIERHHEVVVRLKWSSLSQGTPEILERVTSDAREGTERAHEILVQLVGAPSTKYAENDA